MDDFVIDLVFYDVVKIRMCLSAWMFNLVKEAVIMRIADGVEMLELQAEAFGSRSVLNPTLVWDEDAAVLIDTGMPGLWGQIRAAMESVGVTLDKLKAVILTHQDLDHIGGISEILRESDGRIKVYAHEMDQPYIEGDLPLIKTDPNRMDKMLEALPEDVRRQAIALLQNPPKAKVDATLADGEELPYCGGIQVIYTPGHTPGHISLYLKRSKVLVAADAMVSSDGILAGPVRQTTLDMEEAQRSVAKFVPLDIESVICYHGGLSSQNVDSQLKKLAGQSVSRAES
jgi:glyoxylase-like metal-dependent hydrolase (beta-lactamase superfamily II)